MINVELSQNLQIESNSYLIVEGNKTVGGVETFFFRYIKYLLSIKANVALVTYPESYLDRMIKNELLPVKIFYLPNPVSNNPLLPFPEEKENLNSIGNIIRNTLNGCIRIITYSVWYTHLALYIFREIENWTITVGLMHPEDWPLWSPLSGFDHQHSFNHHHKSPSWEYFGNLLRQLDVSHSLWFAYRSYATYFQRHYQCVFEHAYWHSIPVNEVIHSKAELPDFNKLKVLWLGRFDFFKNPPIVKFASVLERLVDNNKLTQDEVEFHLIGYGNAEFTEDLHCNLSKFKKINIIYHESMPLASISNFVARNKFDFAVAMGTSSFHLGMMGLPVIVLDSANYQHQEKVKGCWLHECSTDINDGSAIYLELIEPEVVSSYKREDLLILVEEYIKDKTIWSEYSNLSIEYINANQRNPNAFSNILDIVHSAKPVSCDMFNISFDDSLLKRIISTKMVYLFGAGGMGRKVIKIIDEYNSLQTDFKRKIVINKVIDNDISKQGTIFCGLNVTTYLFDEMQGGFFIIASDYDKEIKGQLVKSGIDECSIYNFKECLSKMYYWP